MGGISLVGIWHVLVNVVDAILDRLGGQLVVHPVGMITIVLDALALPKRLADKHIALIVAMKRDDVGDIWLRGKQFTLEVFRILELGRSRLRLSSLAGTITGF